MEGDGPGETSQKSISEPQLSEKAQWCVVSTVVEVTRSHSVVGLAIVARSNYPQHLYIYLSLHRTTALINDCTVVLCLIDSSAKSN